MTASRRFVGAMGAALIAATCVTAAELPDRLPRLQDDSQAAPCTAAVRWDGKTVHFRSSQRYVIQCGSSVTTRGEFFRRAATDRLMGDCGAETMLAVPGLRSARARLCADPVLGTRVELATRHWRGWADRDATGPLLAALRIAEAGTVQVRGAAVDPAIVERLAAPPKSGPGGPAVAAAPNRADIATGNQLALQNIYAGRNVEASQVLRDAIAAYPTAAPQDRAALRLNAALAESNVHAFGSADEYLQSADEQIAAIPNEALRATWTERALIYRALHLINQNRWREAQAALSRTASSPLMSPLVLAELNRKRQGGFGQAIDPELLNALILETQAQVALSQATLKLGEGAASQRALDAALPLARALERSLAEQAPTSRDSINWLLGRLERQQGRLSYARGDTDRALASFDCAVADLQAVPPPRTGGCLFAAGRPLGAAVSGPAIADAQLERAAIFEGKSAVDRAAVLQAYQQAVDTLEGFPDAQAAPSALLGHYLDLLIADGGPAATDRFLRALQTVHVPAIARQFNELQLATANGAASDALRTRRVLESRQVQLRARIPLLAPTDPEIADDQREMARNEVQLRNLGRQIKSAGDDRPVAVADLQAGLRPGEAYWRLATVGSRVFGAVVSRDRVIVYAVRRPAAVIDELAGRVLASVRATEGRVPPFATSAAALLFAEAAGKAVDSLRAARSIVVDSADVLHGVPAAVLVTRPVGGTDYAALPFLVRQADLATAVNARAFLQSRQEVRPSQAPHALIGFGDTAPPPVLPPGTQVQVAVGCVRSYAEFAGNLGTLAPIGTAEISAGAQALGDPATPIVSGAAFTDTALIDQGRDGRLAQYQILHFATHGVASRAVRGCSVPIAPSLLTSIARPTQAGAMPSNGLLSFVDIAQLNLDANLVVLSACDTASEVSASLGRLGGQEDAGTAFDGLIRAFFLAHARAVIATSWSIPSGAAQDLMSALYAAGRTQTMGASLRQAQLAVLDRSGTGHPVFWGAFFLVGDGAKPMLTRPAVAALRR